MSELKKKPSDQEFYQSYREALIQVAPDLGRRLPQRWEDLNEEWQRLMQKTNKTWQLIESEWTV